MSDMKTLVQAAVDAWNAGQDPDAPAIRELDAAHPGASLMFEAFVTRRRVEPVDVAMILTVLTPPSDPTP